jgi:hypothetical protein
MVKVVLNGRFGAFSISKEAAEYMAERGHTGAQHELYLYDYEEAVKLNNLRIKMLAIENELETYDIQLPMFSNVEPYYVDPKAQQLCEDLKRLVQEYQNTSAHWYGYGYSPDYPDGYIRHDPLLVESVETLGDAANGSGSKLYITYASNEYYDIDDHDGLERLV